MDDDEVPLLVRMQHPPNKGNINKKGPSSKTNKNRPNKNMTLQSTLLYKNQSYKVI